VLRSTRRIELFVTEVARDRDRVSSSFREQAIGEIARRRQFLVDRCDRERAELAVLCVSFRLPFAGTSIGFLLGKTFRPYPY
jgi:hypothetical protein